MKNILILIFIASLIACGSEEKGSSAAEEQNGAAQSTVDSRMEPKSRPVSDREPEIEIINIDWVYQQDTAYALYKAWIQSKDAKYYLIDGKKGDEVYFELTGGHPKFHLVIIDPNDDEIFRDVMGDEPLEWRKELNEYGTYRFLIQFDPAFEEKEQTKSYFEAKMRMY